jgi:hypothetical protein
VRGGQHFGLAVMETLLPYSPGTPGKEDNCGNSVVLFFKLADDYTILSDRFSKLCDGFSKGDDRSKYLP